MTSPCKFMISRVSSWRSHSAIKPLYKRAKGMGSEGGEGEGDGNERPNRLFQAAAKFWKIAGLGQKGSAAPNALIEG